MVKKILNEFARIFESAIRNLGGRSGRAIRSFYYSKMAGNCGCNLIIDEGVVIQGIRNIHFGNNVWIDKYCILIAGNIDVPEEQLKYKKNNNYNHKEVHLYIGSNVHVAPQCIIQAHGGVSIGDNCGMSSGVKIYSLTNLPSKPGGEIVHFTPLGKAYYFKSPISIDDNVGMALNSMVLAGVSINRDSFVAPNSLVLRSFDKNSFISGNPAERIKSRFVNYNG